MVDGQDCEPIEVELAGVERERFEAYASSVRML